MNDSIPQKLCIRCNQEYPATPQYFHRGKGLYGFHAYCKQCRSLRTNPLPEPPPPGYKRCFACKEIKTLDAFYKNPSLLSGRHSWCKICACSESRQASYRKSSLDYETVLASQHGVCKICGQPPKEDSRLHIDHCHKTDKIRGLLCNNCNLGLGKFKDSPDLLRKAALYLEK